MSDTVLVTGVSGFLGGHVALRMLESGYHVRGSIRNLNRADEVRATLARHGADLDRLDIVALDLTRDEGWAEAMDGVRFLAHTASPFVSSMPADKMELITPAVEGTARALDAALAANVERIVLTSSLIAVIDGNSNGAHYTAENWADPDSPAANAYAESKIRAEKKAWEIMRTAGREADLAVVNPGFILGPLLDSDPGTSGAVLVRLMTGDMPGAPDIQFQCVDVRDVAALHAAALTHPEAGGHRLPIASGARTIFEVGRTLAKAFPDYAGKAPRFVMPNWAVRLYALFDADVRGVVGQLGQRATLACPESRAILGRDPVTPDDAAIAMGETLIAQELV